MRSLIFSKGISPLVAAVLLIAVTMTIAGVLAYWASSFVREGLPELNETQKVQLCSGADFGIFSSSYDANTTQMTIILQNRANVPLKITNVTFIYPTAIEGKQVDVSLPSGGSLSRFVVSNVSAGFSSYSIFTDCPNAFIQV